MWTQHKNEKNYRKQLSYLKWCLYRHFIEFVTFITTYFFLYGHSASYRQTLHDNGKSKGFSDPNLSRYVKIYDINHHKIVKAVSTSHIDKHKVGEKRTQIIVRQPRNYSLPEYAQLFPNVQLIVENSRRNDNLEFPNHIPVRIRHGISCHFLM